MAKDVRAFAENHLPGCRKGGRDGSVVRALEGKDIQTGLSVMSSSRAINQGRGRKERKGLGAAGTTFPLDGRGTAGGSRGERKKERGRGEGEKTTLRLGGANQMIQKKASPNSWGSWGKKFELRCYRFVYERAGVKFSRASSGKKAGGTVPDWADFKRERVKTESIKVVRLALNAGEEASKIHEG